MAKHVFNSGEEFLQACLDWRGVNWDSMCPDCQGTGYKAYGSTATWRGGVGGQTMTSAVCDRCWGSGDVDRPWPSWKGRR